MVIFCLAKVNNDRNMLKVIDDFCKAFGQCINFAKSRGIFLEGIPSDLDHLLFEDKDFVKANSDIKYLGFSYIRNARFTKIMMVIIDRVNHRIGSWTVRPLSQTRRLVMIKSMLLAFPIYIMSCYKLPQFIIKKTSLIYFQVLALS